ncbi:hypothetical protein SALBM217S_01497 [Streptomyces griseoloalbus]
MYSPAERPSSIRAAPAKKRIWSTIGGISSVRVSPTAVGVLHLGRDEFLGALLEGVRDLQQGLLPLGRGGVAPAGEGLGGGRHLAASTSACPDSGAVAYASPVAGLTTSVVRPSAASRNSPPM